jgi:hypothetical protein
VLEVVSKVINMIDDLHTSLDIPVGNCFYGIIENFSIDETKDLSDILISDILPPIRDHLVKEALGISQASFRCLSDREKPSLT